MSFLCIEQCLSRNQMKDTCSKYVMSCHHTLEVKDGDTRSFPTIYANLSLSWPLIKENALMVD